MDLVTREIWKNAAAGLRHYICLNAIGEQTSKTVGPGRTFTVTQLERRLNQEVVYDVSADPFRNGTFLIVKEAEDTEADEIESPDSVTDAEIQEVIGLAMSGDEVPFEAMVARVKGINTAQRIYEEAVSLDASQSIVTVARDRMGDLEELPVGSDGNPIAVGSKEVVASRPPDAASDEWKTKIE